MRSVKDSGCVVPVLRNNKSLNDMETKATLQFGKFSPLYHVKPQASVNLRRGVVQLRNCARLLNNPVVLRGRYRTPMTSSTR